MLTHKEIKKLVLVYRKKAVVKGKVWASEYSINREIEDLGKRTAKMSFDQLHGEQEAIESQLTKYQDWLTSLSVKIHKEEIERSRIGGKPSSWMKALDNYVLTYNKWKTLKALSNEIREIIKEPSVGHRKTARATGGGKGRGKLNSRRQKRKSKGEVVDLSKGTHVNEFIQAGEGWLVTYRGGKKLFLKERKGITYIARLLSMPNSLIHCDQLLVLDKTPKATLNRSDRAPIEEAGEDSADDWKDDDGFHATDRDSEVELVDEKAVSDYRKRLALVDAQLTGKSMSKSVRSRLESERQELRALLGKAGKRWGVISSNDKKKENSVAKAITDSIAAIADAEEKEHVPQSQSLATHLEDSIKKGMQLAYCPLQEIDWRIETKR